MDDGKRVVKKTTYIFDFEDDILLVKAKCCRVWKVSPIDPIGPCGICGEIPVIGDDE